MDILITGHDKTNSFFTNKYKLSLIGNRTSPYGRILLEDIDFSIFINKQAEILPHTPFAGHDTYKTLAILKFKDYEFDVIVWEGNNIIHF